MNNKKSQISLLTGLLESKHNIKLTAGVELEFYLTDRENSSKTEILENNIKLFLEKLSLAKVNYIKERGENQYEVTVEHTSDLFVLLDRFDFIKKSLVDISSSSNLSILFNPKPYLDKYGSGMHIHLNLLDVDSGINLFSADSIDRNDYILNTISGILQTLEKGLYIITGDDENEYMRFVPYFMAPINISWGGNNRTTAIRIPDVEKRNRRIEFRIPSANADLGNIILFLLVAVLYGFDTNQTLPAKIYGNAHDKCYNLHDLPKTAQAAKEKFALWEAIRKQYIDRASTALL